MKVTLLGTGTSSGVPVLGCNCEVCRSKDPRDNRLRCAALIETENTRILIDAGPDIRQQLLRVPFRKMNGVLVTHIHYDHVGGIDDLRGFCIFGDINIYGDKLVTDSLPHTMPYCFPKDAEKLYPGAPKLEAAYHQSASYLSDRRHRVHAYPGDARQDAYSGLPFRKVCLYHGYEVDGRCRVCLSGWGGDSGDQCP